jgi:predicted HAD superfamily hydrolase
MLYSFDVFDTVLTRRVFRPHDIHLLVARDLAADGVWPHGLSAWRDLRIRAERQARMAGAADEITLGEIEAQLRSHCGAACAASAMHLELRHELHEAVAIPAALKAIQELRADGQQIVYISDMYLPQAHVLAMLNRVGAPDAPLFLSSQIGQTKRSGRLFEHVARHHGVPLRTLVHLGDHELSDYRIPRKLGVRATLFKGSLPTPLEASLYQRLSAESPLLAATLAGGMRAARLRQESSSSANPHLSLLATQEAALVHIGYVLWLLAQFGELAPKKTCFLARDGYLPWKAFAVLAPGNAPELAEPAYAFVSRQSLNLAGLTDSIADEDLSWIMLATEALTFADWLFRLGLQHAELVHLPELARALPAADAAFAACRQDCLTLLRTPKFVELILAKAAEARRLASQYLRPLVFPTDGTTAIVDIGWNGRMQRSIVKVLSLTAAEATKIHGHYVGVLRTPQGEFGTYRAWLFDLRSEVRPYGASHFQLFETLFSAPHETTYGYARDAAGEAMPVLAQRDAARSIALDLGEFHQVILGIAASVRSGEHELARAQPAIRALSRTAIARMFRAPEPRHALAFSKMTFSSDQTNLGKERLIHELSWGQQYRCLLDRKFQISSNHWREGQLALADAPLLRTAYALHAALRLLTRGEMSMKEILVDLKFRLTR